MALSFPLSLATFWDVLKFESIQFDLTTFQSIGGLADGTVITSQRATPKWSGTATITIATKSDSVESDALIGSLVGSLGSFQAYDLARPYPKADPGGTILGSSAVTVSAIGGDGKSLKLAGLPAGYVLSLGDYISIPGRKTLHQVLEASVANGSGVSPSFFEVRPPIRAGLTTGDSVVLKKPYGFFRLLPGSVSARLKDQAKAGPASFRFVQVFQ